MGKLVVQAIDNLKDQYPEIGKVQDAIKRDSGGVALISSVVTRGIFYNEVRRLFDYEIYKNVNNTKLRKFIRDITDHGPCIDAMEVLSNCHTVEDIGKHPCFAEWMYWIIAVWPGDAKPFKYEEFEQYILKTNNVEIMLDYATWIRKERWPECEAHIMHLARNKIHTIQWTFKEYCKQCGMTTKEFGNGLL